MFWATAAHLVILKNVGKASAEIAATTLLANLAQLSFTTIFDRFLPIAGNRTHRFVTRAYAMCIAVAFIISTIYIRGRIGGRF